MYSSIEAAPLSASVQSFRAIGPLFMEILHFEDLEDTSVINECSSGVHLVIDTFF